jgi:anoctamin-10/anoctamin-7
MSELVIQFGYVTLFVVAFPLAPLIALFANIIEARVDGWKLVDKCQRPVPLGSNGLGMWTQILEIFSVIAVVTNICLYAFRTDRVAAVFGKEDENGVKILKSEEKYIFVVVCCMILLGLSWLIRALIPDIPESVKLHVERQRAIENVLVKNAAMDSDDEWADFDVEANNRMEDPKKVYLRSNESDPRMKLAKIFTHTDWQNFNSRLKININDRMNTQEPFLTVTKSVPTYEDGGVELGH